MLMKEEITMTNFYDPSLLVKIKKNLVLYRVFFYLSLAILVIGEVIFSFVIEYKNRAIIQPLMIVYGVIFSLVTVLLYILLLYPNKWIIKRNNLMNESYKHEVVGSLVSISNKTTLRRDVVGQELTFVIDDKTTIIFLEENDSNYQFEIGKKYLLKTYDNFIVTVDEVDYE